eukprot:118930-Rhodomonas_salina.1
MRTGHFKLTQTHTAHMRAMRPRSLRTAYAYRATKACTPPTRTMLPVRTALPRTAYANSTARSTDVDATETRKSQGQSPKEAKPSRDDELRKSNVDVKQLTNGVGRVQALKENRMKKAAGSYKQKTTGGGQ